jgi:hypothetical protein
LSPIQKQGRAFQFSKGEEHMNRQKYAAARIFLISGVFGIEGPNERTLFRLLPQKRKESRTGSRLLSSQHPTVDETEKRTCSN